MFEVFLRILDFLWYPDYLRPVSSRMHLVRVCRSYSPCSTVRKKAYTPIERRTHGPQAVELQLLARQSSHRSNHHPQQREEEVDQTMPFTDSSSYGASYIETASQTAWDIRVSLPTLAYSIPQFLPAWSSSSFVPLPLSLSAATIAIAIAKAIAKAIAIAIAS